MWLGADSALGQAFLPRSSHFEALLMYCHGGPTPIVPPGIRGSSVSIRPIAIALSAIIPPIVAPRPPGSPLKTSWSWTSSAV